MARRQKSVRTFHEFTSSPEAPGQLGRLIWAYFFEPREATNPDGTPKMRDGVQVLEYDCTIAFPPTASDEALRVLARAAGTATWGADQTQWPGMDPDNRTFKMPFYKCDTQKDDKGLLKPGHIAGGWFIKPKSSKAPKIIDHDLKSIITPKDVYLGCYGVVSVNCYTYGGPGTGQAPGIGFGLRGFQKLGEGEPLGNRVDVEKEFKRYAPPTGAAAGVGPGVTGTGKKLNPNDML